MPRGWQLLIVDLVLQEGSGLGVLKGCRQRTRQQRVVVLSNYATDDIRGVLGGNFLRVARQTWK